MQTETESPSPSDADLLTRHVAGDKRAFEVLYKRYFSHLVAVARYLGAPDPEDVAQVALARAAGAAATFAGGSSVSTWLSNIARHHVVDGFRYRGRRPPEVTWNETAHGSVCPDPLAERELKETLNSLPPEQREALTMHGVDGYTAVEIGSMLHVNDFTVKSRIRTARRKLRAQMTQEP